MKNIQLLLSLLLTFSIGYNAFGQSYCTPPKYLSGPFTGIQSIKFGGLDHNSNFNDGYSDFTANGKSAIVKPGDSYQVDLTIYYDPAMLGVLSGKLNFRLWVDWNRDFDFDDTDETFLSKVIDCTGVTSGKPTVDVSFNVTIPSGALLGTTRMRVYEDMLLIDGHITPNPCGYLGDTGGLGHHGECEDYKLITSTTVGISVPIPNLVSVYPNPFKEQIHFTETIKELRVYDVQGSLVKIGEKELSSFDMGDLPKGMYIVSFTTLNGEMRKVRLVRI